MEKTKFEVEIDKALQVNALDLVREFYLLETNGYIDQNLFITIYDLDVELLERIVRFYCNIRFFLDKDFNYIYIYGIKESAVEFVTWFIKFFYYLEAMELAENYPNHSRYYPTEEIKNIFNSDFANYKIDISEKRFVFSDVTVKCNTFVNL